MANINKYIVSNTAGIIDHNGVQYSGGDEILLTPEEAQLLKEKIIKVNANPKTQSPQKKDIQPENPEKVEDRQDTDGDSEVYDADARLAKLMRMTKDELVEIAVNMGLAVVETDTKDAIAKIIIEEEIENLENGDSEEVD